MSKVDPFNTLASKPRRITPRKLSGKEKVLWTEFVTKYHNDEFAGLSMNELFAWGKIHCGLTCSVSCFRHELLGRS